MTLPLGMAPEPLHKFAYLIAVVALEKFKKSLQNPPLDWNGDPCLPLQYPWSGITCSYGRRIRVVTL